ncbi:MAG: hypothetical protein R2762_10680 [Bryobacteraceae bacterium]
MIGDTGTHTEGGNTDTLGPLLVRYRRACPDPNPGPAFTPGIWRRIEARRGITGKLRIYARNLATAAATACLLMVGLQYVSVAERSADDSLTYVDALGRDAETEVVAYASFGGVDINEPAPDGGR